MVELPVVECLDRPVLQYALERREVPNGEHVHDEGLFGRGELEQTRLSVPGAQARSLDVRADDFGVFEGLGYAGELVRVGNEPVGRGAFLHTSDSSRITRLHLPFVRGLHLRRWAARSR